MVNFWPILLTILVPVLGYAGGKTPECFIVSGLSRDSQRAFWAIEPLIKTQSRCKVVRSWEDVRPSSAAGTPVLIVQATHGESGGRANCDSGDESAETILKKMKEIGSSRPLGVFSYACYSGDLLSKFLLDQDPAFKHTCLISSSTINRAALGGFENADVRPWELDAGKNLNDFFLTQKQGLSSASAWEGAGYLDLITQHTLNEPMIDAIRARLTPSRQCDGVNKTHTANVIAAICSEIHGVDLYSIVQQSLIEMAYVRAKVPEGMTSPESEKFREEALQSMETALTEMEAFKDRPDLKKIALECRTSEYPFSCAFAKIAKNPQCIDLSSAVKKSLAKSLLGENQHLNGAVLQQSMPIADPAQFLHRFSIESIREGKLRSSNDQARFRACEEFVVNP